MKILKRSENRPIFVNHLLILLFLLMINSGYSQTISGVVLNWADDKPLKEASVYFNNTSIGTTTDANGEFTLEYPEDLKTPLVISFLGYDTTIIEQEYFEDPLKIYLHESTIVLNEVVIDPNDDWSKDLKLQEFKKHYLGQTINGKMCRILNEEDLIFRYKKDDKKLLVHANKPIVIENRNLKYIVTVDQLRCEIKYSHIGKDKKLLNLDYISYSGQNMFRSLQKKPIPQLQELRKEAYLGSSLEFMRALSKKELKNKGYAIFYKDIHVKPKKYIAIFSTAVPNTVKVMFKTKRLDIVYQYDRKSSITSYVKEFYIDGFGNYMPVDKIRFGGEMGAQRMGDALPLDYFIDQ